VLLLVLAGELRANFITISSFTDGGPVTTRTDDVGVVSVQAFGVEGSTLAYWGLNNAVPKGGALTGTSVTLFTGSTTGSVNSISFATPAGAQVGQNTQPRSIAFDSAGRPVITYTNGSTQAVVQYTAALGAFAESLLPFGISDPRFTALATGSNGQIAVAVRGFDDSGVTYIQDSGGKDIQSIPGSFAVPLAIASDGTLSQASVADLGPAGRELYYISRTPGGVWSSSVIDTVGVNLPMTGSIDLALQPNGMPVIIGDSAGQAFSAGDNFLSISELTSSGWTTSAISLDSIFGGTTNSGAYQKEIVFDSAGNAHIALYNGDTTLLYLELSPSLTVLDSQQFALTGQSNFYGMGVAGDGTVFLAYDGGNPSGGSATPAPASVTLALVGLASCLLFVPKRGRRGVDPGQKRR